jgi:hypothetical protein
MHLRFHFNIMFCAKIRKTKRVTDTILGNYIHVIYITLRVYLIQGGIIFYHNT